jgi:hypothetical protein
MDGADGVAPLGLVEVGAGFGARGAGEGAGERPLPECRPPPPLGPLGVLSALDPPSRTKAPARRKAPLGRSAPPAPRSGPAPGSARALEPWLARLSATPAAIAALRGAGGPETGLSVTLGQPRCAMKPISASPIAAVSPKIRNEASCARCSRRSLRGPRFAANRGSFCLSPESTVTVYRPRRGESQDPR